MRCRRTEGGSGGVDGSELASHVATTGVVQEEGKGVQGDLCIQHMLPTLTGIRDDGGQGAVGERAGAGL